MNAPVPFATLVASTLLLAAMAPGNVAAQQSAQSSTPGEAVENTSAPAKRKSDRHRAPAKSIGRAIVMTGASNAFELVSRLHPEWLSNRGPSSLLVQTPIKVYLDRMPLGGIEALRDINVNTIGSIQFLRGPEAAQRFGAGHTAGAIVVTLVGW